MESQITWRFSVGQTKGGYHHWYFNKYSRKFVPSGRIAWALTLFYSWAAQLYRCSASLASRCSHSVREKTTCINRDFMQGRWNVYFPENAASSLNYCWWSDEPKVRPSQTYPEPLWSAYVTLSVGFGATLLYLRLTHCVHVVIIKVWVLQTQYLNAH